MTSSPMTKAIFTLVLPVAALVGGLLSGLRPEAREPSAERPLFLDVFRALGPAVVAKQVEWASAVGRQRGWLIRPESVERLPILLLIASAPADEFAMQTSRELAGIGYAVLIAELQPDTTQGNATTGDKQRDAAAHENGLAQLCAAARWMRRRNDVFPDKVGSLGWGPMGHWALEVAAAQNFQAAVLADADLPSAVDSPLSLGLQHTTVFIVRGAAGASAVDAVMFTGFKNALANARVEHRELTFDTAKKGFMDPRRRQAFDEKAANHAWFEIYEFLGKYVEDAELAATLGVGPSLEGANSAHPFASIGDVMRAVNSPSGLRGAIAEMLRGESLAAHDWILLRSRAAVMADAGVSLMGLHPPRGSPVRFREHAASYRDAAAALMKSADRHDLAEARLAFDRLNTSCRRCHADHR